MEKKKDFNKMWIAFGASFILTLVGIFVLSYSLFTTINYIYCYNSYEQVEGRVNGYSYSSDNKEKNMTIQYFVKGKEYNITSNLKEDEAELNTKIIVKYDAKNPEKYILGNEKMNFGRTVVGGILTIAGVIGMIYTLPRKKEKDIKGE